MFQDTLIEIKEHTKEKGNNCVYIVHQIFQMLEVQLRKIFEIICQIKIIDRGSVNEETSISRLKR